MAIRDTEIYIIEPAAATNLVINPSFETNVTNWTKVYTSDSLAQSATYQRRGTFSCEVTPTSNQISGAYYGGTTPIALTSGTTYYFSLDVLDVAGQTFNMYFQAADGTPTSTATSWVGTGYWRRHVHSWTCSNSENYRLYITRSSVASTTKFYIDGAYCGTVNGTYFDGDSVGFNRNRQDYGWNGTAHASTSWRSAKTRSGGTLLRLRDYAGLEGVIGLGMPPMANNAIPSSGGGAFVQNTVAQVREFTLLLGFWDTAGLSGLYAKRAQLIDAIKPDNVPSDEPIVLRWELEDTTGAVKSETLDLICKYSGGLEYNASESGTAQILERASVTFTAFDPMFIADGSQGADLTVGTSVANAAYLLYRTADGAWTSAGVVAKSTGAIAIKDIVTAPDGKIYVAGSFDSIAGVTLNNIGYWSGAAWNAMGTGLNGMGKSLAIAPDGYPYVGGGFTTANGVTVNHVTKWNGATFVSMDAGANSNVYDVKLDNYGNLYIAGLFTTVGTGATTVNHVAKWTGAAWAALDTGMPAHAGDVLWASVAILGTSIYCAIAYDTNKTDNRVSKWTGAAWVDISCLVESPHALAFGQDGTLYAAGTNDAASDVMMASYNGGSWKSIIAEGVDTGFIDNLEITAKKIYVSGYFTELNNSPYPGNVAEYFNGTFRPVDISLSDGTNSVYALCETPSGALWVGGEWSTTPLVTPGITASTNGSSKSYPVIRFTGPGKLWQLKNYTTGKSIWFNNLTLQAGETAILDLRPGRVRFMSDWRGNILKYLPGSDFDFFLQSGANNISLYMTGTSAATKALLSYQNRYWSIDAAAR